MNKQAIVEGALIASGKPLSIEDIKRMFQNEEGEPSIKEIKTILSNITSDCHDRGYELKELASGYRLQVKQEYAKWIGKLWEEKPPKYSKAILEIMAIIAYKQPVTRSEIEEIRGVAVSTNAIRMLIDRQWIKVIAHKDIPGRPAVYGTTKDFLDYFNLSHLNELPEIDLTKIVFSKEVIDDDVQKGFQLEHMHDETELDDTSITEEIDISNKENIQQDDNIIDVSDKFLEKQKENLHISESENSNNDLEIIK